MHHVITHKFLQTDHTQRLQCSPLQESCHPRTGISNCTVSYVNLEAKRDNEEVSKHIVWGLVWTLRSAGRCRYLVQQSAIYWAGMIAHMGHKCLAHTGSSITLSFLGWNPTEEGKREKRGYIKFVFITWQLSKDIQVFSILFSWCRTGWDVAR